MPRLQVLNGKRQGAVFDVHPGVETIIGHRQSATISIDDPWVSWDHARLFFNGEGTCWIEDLGSTNGTFVNCVRVKREVLRHEDIIFLGKTHVLFLSPAEESIPRDLFGPPTQPPLGQPGAPVLHAPSSSAGQPRIPATAASLPSSMGAFNSDSGLPPLRDPFASSSSPPPWAQPQKAKRDPFADSSVDPFASGPEFVPSRSAPAPLSTAPSPSAPPDPARARRAFADTNADDEVLGRPGPTGRSLSLSDLNEDLGPRSAPPVHEISQLIEGYDDLDTILGDGRARTPDPAALGWALRGGPASEMRTRPIDTEAARRVLAEEAGAAPPRPVAPGAPTLSLPAVGAAPRRADAFEPSSAQGPPIVAAPGPPSERTLAPGYAAAQERTLAPGYAAPQERTLAPGYAAPQAPAPPPPPPPAPPPPASPAPGAESSPEALDPPTLAFERARLDDEVRRLRAALQAAREANPQAVKIAAETLRDQELGRLARRVAELERDLTRLRQELDEKQVELDRVTEEMIDKEDRIERLEAEVERLRAASAATATSLGQSTDPDLEMMELP